MEYGVTEVFLKNWYYANLLNPVEDWKEKGKYKYKYILNIGSSRSSKTYSLCEMALRFCEQNTSKSKLNISIWREDREKLTTTVWKNLRDIIPLSNRNIEMVKNTTSIYVGSTGVLTPIQCDYNKAHGSVQDISWINEPLGVTRDVFEQINLRSSQIWIDYNPYEIDWIRDLEKNDKSIVIHSTFRVNPFCPPDERATILSYEVTPFNIENGTADEYRWQVYGLGLKAEKPNKIFHDWKVNTLDEFNKLPYDSYYGLDWGLQAPTTLVEVKYDGDGNFYAHELLYMSELEIIDLLKKRFGEGWQKAIADKGHNAISLMLENLNINKNDTIVCDNNKPQKIRELRIADYNAIPASKGKASVEFGISFLQRCNITYTRESKNLQMEYESYEWEIVKGMNLERPIKKKDHLLDAFRYIAVYLKYTLGINV